MMALHATAKDIVDLITGKRIATDSVLVDAAQMKFQTVLTYDTSVSMHERAKACEALWSFQFKGDMQKEAVIRSNGVTVCYEIIRNPPRVTFKDKEDLALLRKNAFVTVRSLATHPYSSATLIESGIVDLMVSLAFGEEVADADRILAFETLVGVAQNNKEQRRILVDKHDVFTRLFGLRDRPDLDPQHFLLDSGLEPFAHAALSLVEVLITKDKVREFLVDKSQAVRLFFSVMHNANDDAQGLVCRLASRICEHDRCKVMLRRADFSAPVGQLFLRTASKTAKAMASAALCNLVSGRDEELARECVPDLIATLKRRRRKFHDHEQQAQTTQQQILIPGALRALRAFAKIPFVQDKVVSEQCLRPVVEVALDVESPPHARADAVHVIGSVALQIQHHTAIFSASDISPLAPLLVLIKDGDAAQQAVAARAVQNLTCNPSLRNKFATFRESKVQYDPMTLHPHVEKWDAVDVVTELLHRSHSPKCRACGAGIMRNFTGIEPVRVRVIQDAASFGTGAVPRLVLILQERPKHLAACTHAAAALGNLSRKPEWAAVICRTGDGRVVHALLALLALTYGDVEETADQFYLEECRLNAATTLGQLAYDQTVSYAMMDNGFMTYIQHNLSSRSPSKLRLASAQALHNLSSFPGCARRIMKDSNVVDSLLKNLKTENEEVQVNLVAVVSNLFALPENMVVCKERKWCSAIVWVIRKGVGRAKLPAVEVVKKASKSMDLDICGQLVKAGVITAMVPLMRAGNEASGGVGEMVACTVGRLAACDDDFALQCVDAKAIDGLMFLLDNGGEGAAVQAAKTLLILIETPEYRGLMMQLNGMAVANRVLHNGSLRACWVFAQDLLASWTEQAPIKELTTFEKTIAKRRAEARAIAQQLQNQQGFASYDGDGSPVGNASPLRNIGRHPVSGSPAAHAVPIRAGHPEAVEIRFLGEEEDSAHNVSINQDHGRRSSIFRTESGGKGRRGSVSEGARAEAMRRQSTSRKVTFGDARPERGARLPSIPGNRSSR